MKKAILQFLIFLSAFLGLWFVLSKIDWIALFRIEKISKTSERKLGEIFWDSFSNSEKVIHSETVSNTIDTLLERVCSNNSIDQTKIKVHILLNQEVNAFTLPDHHLVIYSGLIENVENESELIGVMSHELAHMEKNHVMKKIVKEFGLSALLTMTASRGGGGKLVTDISKTLSSTAYDRRLEREADLTAADYMIQANIDPEQFANFLSRLSDKYKDLPSQAYWITTHPESQKRADDIMNHIHDKEITKGVVLSKNTLKKVKAELKGKVKVLDTSPK